MKEKFEITEKIFCTGCSACAAACPADAISMKTDSEGFERPEINFDACLFCGTCRRVCPANSDVPNGAERTKKFFMGWAKDAQLRCESSSGGLFSALADAVFEDGGGVCGAVYENGELRHKVIFDKSDMPKLRGSKYLQSSLSGVLREIKKIIESGRKVLFAGTPCQVAGLRALFPSVPENLICADLLCHGVPSPAVFKEYAQKVSGGVPDAVSFRDKSSGWGNFSLKILKGGAVAHQKTVSEDPYLRGFFSEIFSRECCQRCKYAALKRMGDISLGDFWSVGKFYPNVDARKGVSLALINSPKGAALFEKISAKLDGLREVNERQALKSNAVLHSPIRASYCRTAFFRAFAKKSRDIVELIKKYSAPRGDTLKGKFFKFASFAKSLFFARNMFEEPEDIDKRVGVLNLSYGNFNFGAVLLSYASQKTIFKLGFTPWIINYDPTLRRRWRLSYIRGMIAGMNFVKFRYSYLNTTEICGSEKALRKLNARFENFAIGSDQVWRYAISKENCGIYFGGFVEGKKNLFSWAASFGKDVWDEAPEAVTKEIRESLIKKFSAVSVRENSGIDICRESFGRNDAVNVLDPTLMLDADDYAQIYLNSDSKYSTENFVAVSALDYSDVIMESVKAASAHFAAPAKDLISRPVNFFGVKKPVYNSVADWLAMIKNARFVVTDSFHCVAFSIIFRKKFACVGSSHRGNDRLANILDKLGLSERFVSSAQELSDILDKEIDYDAVYARLGEERAKSLEFLKRALGKTPENQK